MVDPIDALPVSVRPLLTARRAAYQRQVVKLELPLDVAEQLFLLASMAHAGSCAALDKMVLFTTRYEDKIAFLKDPDHRMKTHLLQNIKFLKDAANNTCMCPTCVLEELKKMGLNVEHW